MTFKGILIFCCMLFFSCKEEEIGVIDNLNGGKIIVCGHGGSGFQSYVNPYPTNSFVSIQRALEGYNADGVEVDVQITKDKKLFLYHDKDLNVSTGCTGCIPSMLSTEIENCKYDKNISGNVFSDERLISLEELLSHYSDLLNSRYFYLDMRIDNECDPNALPDKDTLANEAVKMIQKYSAYKFMPVISGDTSLLNTIKKIDNKVNLILENNNVALAIFLASNLNYSGIICGNEDISKEQVKDAHLKNLQVILFNVKRRNTTIEAIKKCPDAIQTDNLQLLQEVLREYQK